MTNKNTQPEILPLKDMQWRQYQLYRMKSRICLKTQTGSGSPDTAAPPRITQEKKEACKRQHAHRTQGLLRNTIKPAAQIGNMGTNRPAPEASSKDTERKRRQEQGGILWTSNWPITKPENIIHPRANLPNRFHKSAECDKTKFKFQLPFPV